MTLTLGWDSLLKPIVPNAAVGPTLIAILKDQFERLRDGDRFWYEAYLDPATLSVVQNTTLCRHHPPQHNHYNGDSKKRLGFCSAYTTADSYWDSDSKPDAALSNALTLPRAPTAFTLTPPPRTRRQPAITRSRGRIPSYIRK